MDPSLDEAASQLYRVSMALARRLGTPDPVKATGHELTRPQLAALVWLGREGAMKVGELAKRIGATPSRGTRVVDALLEKGLVERRPSPRDRRVVLVEVTREGAAAARALERFTLDTTRQILRPLSVEDRRALVDIFGRLVEALGQEPPHG